MDPNQNKKRPLTNYDTSNTHLEGNSMGVASNPIFNHQSTQRPNQQTNTNDVIDQPKHIPYHNPLLTQQQGLFQQQNSQLNQQPQLGLTRSGLHGTNDASVVQLQPNQKPSSIIPSTSFLTSPTNPTNLAQFNAPMISPTTQQLLAQLNQSQVPNAAFQANQQQNQQYTQMNDINNPNPNTPHQMIKPSLLNSTSFSINPMNNMGLNTTMGMNTMNNNTTSTNQSPFSPIIQQNQQHNNQLGQNMYSPAQPQPINTNQQQHNQQPVSLNTNQAQTTPISNTNHALTSTPQGSSRPAIAGSANSTSSNVSSTTSNSFHLSPGHMQSQQQRPQQNPFTTNNQIFQNGTNNGGLPILQQSLSGFGRNTSTSPGHQKLNQLQPPTPLTNTNNPLQQQQLQQQQSQQQQGHIQSGQFQFDPNHFGQPSSFPQQQQTLQPQPGSNTNSSPGSNGPILTAQQQQSQNIFNLMNIQTNTVNIAHNNSLISLNSMNGTPPSTTQARSVQQMIPNQLQNQNSQHTPTDMEEDDDTGLLIRSGGTLHLATVIPTEETDVIPHPRSNNSNKSNQSNLLNQQQGNILGTTQTGIFASNQALFHPNPGSNGHNKLSTGLPPLTVMRTNSQHSATNFHPNPNSGSNLTANNPLNNNLNVLGLPNPRTMSGHSAGLMVNSGNNLNIGLLSHSQQNQQTVLQKTFSGSTSSLHSKPISTKDLTSNSPNHGPNAFNSVTTEFSHLSLNANQGAPIHQPQPNTFSNQFSTQLTNNGQQPIQNMNNNNPFPSLQSFNNNNNNNPNSNTLGQQQSLLLNPNQPFSLTSHHNQSNNPFQQQSQLTSPTTGLQNAISSNNLLSSNPLLPTPGLINFNSPNNNPAAPLSATMNNNTNTANFPFNNNNNGANFPFNNNMNSNFNNSSGNLQFTSNQDLQPNTLSLQQSFSSQFHNNMQSPLPQQQQQQQQQQQLFLQQQQQQQLQQQQQNNPFAMNNGGLMPNSMNNGGTSLGLSFPNNTNNNNQILGNSLGNSLNQPANSLFADPNQHGNTFGQSYTNQTMNNGLNHQNQLALQHSNSTLHQSQPFIQQPYGQNPYNQQQQQQLMYQQQQQQQQQQMLNQPSPQMDDSYQFDPTPEKGTSGNSKGGKGTTKNDEVVKTAPVPPSELTAKTLQELPEFTEITLCLPQQLQTIKLPGKQGFAAVKKIPLLLPINNTIVNIIPHDFHLLTSQSTVNSLYIPYELFSESDRKFMNLNQLPAWSTIQAQSSSSSSKKKRKKGSNHPTAMILGGKDDDGDDEDGNNEFASPKQCCIALCDHVIYMQHYIRFIELLRFDYELSQYEIDFTTHECNDKLSEYERQIDQEKVEQCDLSILPSPLRAGNNNVSQNTTSVNNGSGKTTFVVLGSNPTSLFHNIHQDPTTSPTTLPYSVLLPDFLRKQLQQYAQSPLILHLYHQALAIYHEQYPSINFKKNALKYRNITNPQSFQVQQAPQVITQQQPVYQTLPQSSTPTTSNGSTTQQNTNSDQQMGNDNNGNTPLSLQNQNSLLTNNNPQPLSIPDQQSGLGSNTTML